MYFFCVASAAHFFIWKERNEMPQNNSVILGLKLRYCRKSAGFKQSQISELCEIERSGISYYESGKILPSIQYLVTFSKKFGVSIDDLADNEISFDDFTAKYPVSHFINIKAMT